MPTSEGDQVTWGKTRSENDDGGCSSDIKVIGSQHGYSISHIHSKIWLRKRDLHLSELITCLNMVTFIKREEEGIPLNDTTACWMKLLLTRTKACVCVQCVCCAQSPPLPLSILGVLPLLSAWTTEHRHGLTHKAARAKCTSSWNLWQMKIVEEGKTSNPHRCYCIIHSYINSLSILGYRGLCKKGNNRCEPCSLMSHNLCHPNPLTVQITDARFEGETTSWREHLSARKESLIIVENRRVNSCRGDVGGGAENVLFSKIVSSLLLGDEQI